MVVTWSLNNIYSYGAALHDRVLRTLKFDYFDSHALLCFCSGDKDFIPALVRTRQKGRKVGIVSMKTGEID